MGWDGDKLDGDRVGMGMKRVGMGWDGNELTGWGEDGDSKLSLCSINMFHLIMSTLRGIVSPICRIIGIS